MDYAKLSREVSYALRHAPREYELEPDEKGWVDLEQLPSALRESHKWKELRGQDLTLMM